VLSGMIWAIVGCVRVARVRVRAIVRMSIVMG
jgi:hypothetical protein